MANVPELLLIDIVVWKEVQNCQDVHQSAQAQTERQRCNTISLRSIAFWMVPSPADDVCGPAEDDNRSNRPDRPSLGVVCKDEALLELTASAIKSVGLSWCIRKLEPYDDQGHESQNLHGKQETQGIQPSNNSQVMSRSREQEEVASCLTYDS